MFVAFHAIDYFGEFVGVYGVDAENGPSCQEQLASPANDASADKSSGPDEQASEKERDARHAQERRQPELAFVPYIVVCIFGCHRFVVYLHY